MGTYEHYYLINQIDTMKKLLHIIAVIAVLCCACGKEYDDSELVGRVTDLEGRVLKIEQLCQQMNTNISSLQTIVSALQNNDYVTGVTPVVENGKTVGYTISFTKSPAITVYHGKDGTDGKDGQDGADGKSYVPVIGVKQDADGIYYWTLDGKWLTDSSGNKIKAEGRDGKDGQNGRTGVTPKFKIEDDCWAISYDNGGSWTKLGKATGDNGRDGDSFFRSVSHDDDNVYFVLDDGTTLTLPKTSPLSITFDESDLVVMSPNSVREVGYSVTSKAEAVQVEVTSSADIKAKVIEDVINGKTGRIRISTGPVIDEYSKVIVFVSIRGKLIMRSITFEEAGLAIDDNAEKSVSAKGGEVTLEFLSNIECEAVIPDDAKSWISVVPETRVLEKQKITINIEPNRGYDRKADISVASIDGKLNLEYQIEQKGDLGIVDLENVPNNEIRYRTENNTKYDVEKLFSLSGRSYKPFNSDIISHEYSNGIGIITLKEPVKTINEYAFGITMGDASLTSADCITELYLPDCVEHLAAASIFGTKIQRFRVPSSLKTYEIGAIHQCNYLEFFEGKSPYVSTDGHSIIIDGTLYKIASYNVKEYTIPSNVKIIAEDAACHSISLEKIVFSENIGIVDRAFSDCTSLNNVKLNNGLEIIKGYAFSNTAIEEITFPNTLKEIWGYAFASCDNISEVVLPNSLTGIGNGAFSGHGLRKFSGKFASFDNRCIIVDGWLKCFAGNGLTSYSIPNGVVAISDFVFAGTDLIQVDIPTTVSYIGSSAFQNCKRLTEIALPSELRDIESFTFKGCINLATITLPNSIIKINSCAFEGCGNLSQIFCKATMPPTLYKYAIEIPANCIIYVPEQSLLLYQKYSDWAPFKANIRGYHYIDLPEVDYYVSSDYSQDGKVATMQSATKGKGINVVLMGDAYSDRQIADGTYGADMKYIYDNIFTEEPYKSFKEYFNVYSVNAVSATEGYDHGGAALGGYFGGGTLVGGNDKKCFEYAVKAVGEQNMDEALVVVAMNSDNYAGTCYMYYPSSTNGTYGSGTSVAYFPKGGDKETFARLLHHEACGHGFAKLADEYAYESMGTVPSDYVSQTQTQQNNWGWWKNVDFTNDLSAVRWSRFISDSRYADEGLGAFEGGLTYWSGVWRPTENSIMRHNTGGFNAPSREAIYYRIHKLAYGDSWEYDYENFVKYDEINRKASSSAHWNAFNPENYRPLHPPVVVGKSWKDVTRE